MCNMTKFDTTQPTLRTDKHHGLYTRQNCLCRPIKWKLFNYVLILKHNLCGPI